MPAQKRLTQNKLYIETYKNGYYCEFFCLILNEYQHTQPFFGVLYWINATNNLCPSLWNVIHRGIHIIFFQLSIKFTHTCAEYFTRCTVCQNLCSLGVEFEGQLDKKQTTQTLERLKWSEKFLQINVKTQKHEKNANVNKTRMVYTPVEGGDESVPVIFRTWCVYHDDDEMVITNNCNYAYVLV